MAAIHRVAPPAGRPEGLHDFCRVACATSESLGRRSRRRGADLHVRRARDQRPPSLRRRRRQPPRAERGRGRPLTAPPRDARACEGAQRVKRVVGDRSLPDEIPQGVDGFGRVAAAHGLVQRSEERRAVGLEILEDRGFAIGELTVRLKRPTRYVARHRRGQLRHALKGVPYIPFV